MSDSLRGENPGETETTAEGDNGKEVETSSRTSPTDEQFLNVLRKADRPFLETAVFKEELDIVQRTAQKRLNTLENEGRVESEQIGQPKLWWLVDSEPQEPVKEEGARLLRLTTRLERFSQGFGYAALGFFGMSGFLLLIYLTVSAQDIELLFFGTEGVTFAALLCAFCAGIGLSFWGVLRGVTLILRTALKRGWIGTIGT